ncbi:hypothetical protein niasHS_001323 [Heterodera schachtii]|uniref:Uncharacterized protein n=1 Tax=Heterodera schachtii TaxID=97005 RepID=A0ABD2KIR0_HETSC
MISPSNLSWIQIPDCDCLGVCIRPDIYKHPLICVPEFLADNFPNLLTHFSIGANSTTPLAVEPTYTTPLAIIGVVSVLLLLLQLFNTVLVLRLPLHRRRRPRLSHQAPSIPMVPFPPPLEVSSDGFIEDSWLSPPAASSSNAHRQRKQVSKDRKETEQQKPNKNEMDGLPSKKKKSISARVLSSVAEE